MLIELNRLNRIWPIPGGWEQVPGASLQTAAVYQSENTLLVVSQEEEEEEQYEIVVVAGSFVACRRAYSRKHLEQAIRDLHGEFLADGSLS